MDAPIDAAEVYALLTEAVDAILTIVTIYFSIVSAYIAALYYFLRQAPFLLKLVAFMFLSGALAFIGLVIILVERFTSSVVEAIGLNAALPEPRAMPFYPFGGDFGGAGADAEGYAYSLYVFVVGSGWLLAIIVYVALFYLTFFHRWRSLDARAS